MNVYVEIKLENSHIRAYNSKIFNLCDI